MTIDAIQIVRARRHVMLPLDDLADEIRNAAASRVEDLPALHGCTFDASGKPREITAAIGAHNGAMGFDRAATIAAGVRSILFSAPDGKGWRVITPLQVALPAARHTEAMARLEVLFGPVFDPRCQNPARPLRYGSPFGTEGRVVVTSGVPIERIRLPHEMPWRTSENGNEHLYFGELHAVTRQTEDGNFKYGIAVTGRKGMRWRSGAFPSRVAVRAAVATELSRLGPAIDDSG
jgi:hypothetical protein